MIGFDADDTLWHNEDLYRQAKQQFKRMFEVEHDPRAVEKRLDEIEVANVSWYGYGIKSFTLSMLETALELSGETLQKERLQQLFQIGRQMLDTAVPLFPEAESTLAELAASYPLLLITKGDTFEQSRKIHRTGLEKYFRAVEIVGDKTVETYQAILKRHQVDPLDFIMVGNSLRSDILPVIELGGRAIYIPYATTWAHEQVNAPIDGHGRYYELEHLGQLPGLVRNILKGAVNTQRS